jgi:hypothetical protein
MTDTHQTMADSPPKPNNYAFIDSQNLNLSIQQLGWKLDFYRFRKYLAEKYHVTRALIFVGYVEENADLYNHLINVGYELVYKPTLAYKDGTMKGNVDAELVLHTMIEQHLITHNKLAKLIIPNKFNYSSLLKRFDSQYLAFVSDLRSRMTYVKRPHREPDHDGPHKTGE